MMGQSLATRAVSGGTTSYSLSDEALDALKSGDIAALLQSHKARFGGFTMELDDDSDDDQDDDAGGGDDQDDDEDDGDDDDADDKSKTSSRVKELSDENAKWRLKYKNRGQRIAQLEAEIEKLKQGKPKSKSEDDDDDAGGDDKSNELKTENEKLKEKLVTQQIRMEFNDLVTGSDALAKFKNPKTAFRLLDLSEVEIDEDGDITGLDDAIKALAKSDPYLLDTGKDDEDEDERQPTAGQPTGRKKGRGNPNRDKLLEKYPALRR